MTAFNPAEAYKLPAPKGCRCAAGCGHGISAHREAGCDVMDGAEVCACGAPYGRIPPADPEPTDGQPFSPLVGAILTQMATDSAYTTNALLDGYKTQLRNALAELYAIREGVSALLNERWAPSARSVQSAVFAPDLDLLAEGRRIAEQEVP